MDQPKAKSCRRVSQSLSHTCICAFLPAHATHPCFRPLPLTCLLLVTDGVDGKVKGKRGPKGGGGERERREGEGDVWFWRGEKQFFEKEEAALSCISTNTANCCCKKLKCCVILCNAPHDSFAIISCKQRGTRNRLMCHRGSGNCDGVGEVLERQRHPVPPRFHSPVPERFYLPAPVRPAAAAARCAGAGTFDSPSAAAEVGGDTVWGEEGCTKATRMRARGTEPSHLTKRTVCCGWAAVLHRAHRLWVEVSGFELKLVYSN